MYNPIDFSHERNLTDADLSRRVEAYYPDADFALLKKAYQFAEKAHQGQKRSSGENYIIHPLNVASILIKLRMDINTIIAGLLHDVVEDCNITPQQLEDEFSPEISEIVVGLTKISKIKLKTHQDSQAENFRKMIVAMAKDIRVIIVKLADRMHNMKTLQYVNEAKQKRIARETLDIYVPLASRLGVNSVKVELEDLCLRFLHPDIYYRLAEKMAKKKEERDTLIKEVIALMKDKLAEYSVKADVIGRAKHFYSTYKKMISRGVSFEQIQDILAFRVIADNITECYKTLGIIHSSYTPVPGRFKDYIAIPKNNGYQSLHTTVIGPKAERIEIQIRTHDMNDIAETGIAAHWKYKEGISGKTTQFGWVENLLEMDKQAKSSSEFMDAVKGDLYTSGVFVFTPNGDVRELCYGATPLDFAYSVHTEIGNQCVGAKVNNRMVPLKYELKSGDTVEILTQVNQTPSKSWLTIARSPRARTRIRQWLLGAERKRNQNAGHEILEKTFKIFGTSLKTIQKSGEMKHVFEKFNLSGIEELCISVGSDKIKTKDIINIIPSLKKIQTAENTPQRIHEIDTYSKELRKGMLQDAHRHNAVIVNGMEDFLTRIAKCCNPVPGDAIIGYITRGQGVTVHSSTCPRVDRGEIERMINVEWNPEFNFRHPVNIKVIIEDKPGILSSISRAISDVGVNIRSAIAKSAIDQKGSIIFEVEVKDYSELLKAISRVEELKEVIAVSRV